MNPPLTQRMGSAALASLLTSSGTPAPAPKVQFLHAGQVAVSTESQTLAFILGSCVGVCLWDPTSHMGGATHFLLPESDGRSPASPRYGDVAIAVLLHKLKDAGARIDRLRAKVFGGGSLLNLSSPDSLNTASLGSRNVEIASEILRKNHIPVDVMDVGGTHGKRISFRTDTGETTVKEL